MSDARREEAAEVERAARRRSNVRIPRSQRRTSLQPAARMYSAAESHSSTVVPKPRLSITGRPAAPASFRRS